MRTAEVLFGLRLAFLTLAASTVLAWLRNPLANLLTEGMNFWAVPLRLVGQTLARGASSFRGHATRSLDGLAYSPEGYREAAGDRGVWAGWALIVPFFWLASATIATIAEAKVLYLRNAALLGEEGAGGGNHAAAFLTLAWAACVVSYGLLLFDLMHASPLRQPFGKMRGRARTTMLVVAMLGVSLAVAGAVLSLLWGQLRIMGVEEPDLALTYLAILIALVIGALVLSGWSLPVCLGAIWCATATVFALLLASLRLLLQLAFHALDISVSWALALLELVAWPGLAIWNWLAGFPLARRLRLGQIEWERRPRVGALFSPFQMPDERDSVARPKTTLDDQEPEESSSSARREEREEPELTVLAGGAEEPASPGPSITERRWEGGQGADGLPGAQP